MRRERQLYRFTDTVMKDRVGKRETCWHTDWGGGAEGRVIYRLADTLIDFCVFMLKEGDFRL